MSNKIKYEKLQKRVVELEKRDKDKEIRLSRIEERNILDDINRETFPGSGRWFYTYENIADRNNISASTVSRIAERHGVSRRGMKSV
ncbi:hypothetical protein [Clostridium sp.]|jgi:hypothetical protein|uniref:hypothetical protein n=1 Tax=Clostridium sp. TaxID=1506 RepID=UPI0025BC8B6E|nr:hypothetical protein [Clostridium sp.]MCI9069108.1 hypothetical protein [Clostridium sp.]